MDIEKLIERLKKASADGSWNTLADYAHKAATALSMLQAENEKLRAENIRWGQVASEQDKQLDKLQAELEQAKQERDAAVERIMEWEKFDTYLLIHNFLTPEKWRGQKED